MADLSNLAAVAPQLLKQLPAFLQILQILSYAFFVLFFGSIIIRGFRGYLPWHIKLLGRVGFGFIALVCSVALSPFMPVNDITRIFQLDLLMAGIVSTAALTLSLLLISHGFYNRVAIEKALERLKARLEKARVAEKDSQGKTKMQRLLSPMRVVGIAIFAAFIIVSLLNFTGFPDPGQNLLSSLGLSKKDIEDLSKYIEASYPNQSQSMPQGCVSPLELAQNFGEDILNNRIPPYSDPVMKSLIETGSKETVLSMYQLDYEGRAFTLAVTVRQGLCSATGSEFCGCVNLSGQA